MYKNAGYTGIVITDHYYKGFFNSLNNNTWAEKVDVFTSGYKLAYSYGKDYGLEVLFGLELALGEHLNHYLVYGLDETILKSHPEIFDLSLKDLKSLVESYQGLIFQAHPFRPGNEIFASEYLDGIEVFNGNPRHPSKNYIALAHAQEHNLKGISGSDFHQTEDLGRGGIILDEHVASTQELVKWLSKKSEIPLIGDPTSSS